MKNRITFAIIIFLVLALAVWQLFFNKEQESSYAYLGAAMVDSSSVLATKEMSNQGIKPQNFSSGIKTAQALLGGGVDFATMAEWPFLLSTKSRDDLRVIAMISVAANLGILARTENGNTDLEQMRNKKIGLPLGTTPQFLVESLLSNVLNKEEYQIVGLAPGQLQAALLGNDVDAISVWQPILEKSRLTDTNKLVYLKNSQQHVKTHYLIVSTVGVLNSKPVAAENILKSILNAEKLINEGNQEALNQLSKAMGLEINVLRELLPLFEFEMQLDGRLVEVWQRMAPWAVDSGLAEPQILSNDWRKFIDIKPMSAVSPSRVRLE